MSFTISGSHILGSAERLVVLVPSAELGKVVSALSTRIHAFPVPLDGEVLSGEATEAQVLVTAGSSRPDPELLAQLPRLRLLQLTTVGAENFVGMLPAGVTLANARGAHTMATAEWVLAAILSVQGGIPQAVRQQVVGCWEPSSSRSLAGSRAVVIGAGNIGLAVGRMLEGFNVDLTYVGRSARADVHGAEELPDLLTFADIVILTVPLTQETHGMVDGAFLAAMPNGALLVNASRGAVVHTEALLAELARGRLRAALDVTDPEPLPTGHPLWSAPNLLLTPHVAGSVPQASDRAAAVILEQLRRVLAGEELLNVVDSY